MGGCVLLMSLIRAHLAIDFRLITGLVFRSWFDPPVQQHSFMEIGHESISTAILSLPLIQVGQLLAKGRELSIG